MQAGQFYEGAGEYRRTQQNTCGQVWNQVWNQVWHHRHTPVAPLNAAVAVMANGLMSDALERPVIRADAVLIRAGIGSTFFHSIEIG